MASLPSAFKRPGVAPQFPKIAEFIAQLQELRPDSSDQTKWLAAYASGQPADLRAQNVSSAERVGLWEVSQALGTIARDLSYRAQCAALTAQPKWLDDWCRGVAYAYWSQRLAIHHHRAATDELRAGTRTQRLQMLALHEAGFLVGACMAVGWVDHAREMAVKIASGLDEEFYFDGDDFGHRRAQLFVLRLILDWHGATREWPSYAYDVPAYDYIVHHWRDAQEPMLVEALLASCDRHTHEVRSDANQGMFDIREVQYTYYPFEILTVLRLRAAAGLTVPLLDHTLMRTPLGQLPSPQPQVSDELLLKVVAQVRREYGNF